MEKRTILVIVFSVVFILLYQKFVLERFAPKKPASQLVSEEKASKSEPVVTGGGDAAVPDVDGELTVSAPETVADTVNVPHRVVTLENEKLRIQLDNHGAVIRSIVLKGYTDQDGNPMELINPEALNHGWLPLRLEGPTATADMNWQVEERDGHVRFQLGGQEKEVTLGDGYIVQVQIRGGSQEWLSAGAGIDRAERAKGRYSSPDTVAVYSGKDLERIKKKNLEKPVDLEQADWVAVEDRYFARILDPAGTVKETRTRGRSYQADGKRFTLSEVMVPIPASGSFSLYMGPKKYDTLKKLGNGYEQIVNFGFFGMFAKWLFFALNAMNRGIGNYGWTIVVLTLLIRILLFPLNQAGLKSMKKMQTIQPKIKAIQEKYKKYGKDMAMKQKMNQEMQELYKSEGVNPLGGCLPMLIQMPIFFAFWSLLLNAIELRQAPFMLWIRDLSMHDPYFILPVLMGVTQLVSQVITPSTGDKNQKRMMYALPIVFTVVLAYAPSGLIVYWTTNNIAQIFQQILINRATEVA